MKKFISILLCLALLLASVSILTSCSMLKDLFSLEESEGPPEPDDGDDDGGEDLPDQEEVYKNHLDVSEDTVAVDLTGYSLVYSGDASAASQTTAKEFAALIQTKTGVSVQTSRASTSTSYTGNQILVGVNDANASQEALAMLDGHGWIITVIDDYLVVTGTTQIFTNMAIEYFSEHYLAIDAEDTTVDKSAILSINQQARLINVPVVSLINTTNATYSYEIIYSDILDDEEGWAHIIPGDHSGGNSTDTVDRPVRLAEEVDTFLYEFVPVKDKVNIVSDVNQYEREICVGLVDREACREAMANLSPVEYGFFVRDSKIIIGAWNDECIDYAATLFQNAVRDSYYEEADGSANVVLPANYSIKGEIESEWAISFPKPSGEGIQLAGTLSSGDNSLIYAYQGTGVTAAAFDSYCATLERNGYILVQENTIDSNKFATYKNTTANITLHVEYAAYQNSDTMTTSYYLAPQYVQRFQPTIRITSAPLDSVTLLTTELLNANAWKSVDKITDPMITQVDVDYGVGDKGMFYIITLEDGTFIIVDGATNRNAVDDKLWTILNNLYYKAHGTTPTASNPIHIRAWLLTHEHSDHYTVLYHFLRDYGSNTKLQFDYLLANFTSATQDYNAMQPAHYIYNNLAYLQGKCPGFEYIKVHTGQKIYIQNVTLEVLFTHQDIAPYRQHFFNDTSTVFKTSIYTTNGSGTKQDENIFMILGDAALITSTFMRGMYSVNTLNSDMVQIGHHGGFGCEPELYDMMTPTVTYWAYSADGVENFAALSNRDNQSLEYRVAYHVLREMQNHLYAYMAEGYATTLTLSKNGPLYDQLYDANVAHNASGASITYDNLYVVDVYQKYGTR